MRQTNKQTHTAPPQDQPDWSSALGEFPAYTDLFLQTQNLLMTGNGPLPLTDRHYIALKASSISGCDGLERLQEELFLRAGGEKAWLAGEVPTRLRRLEKVNHVLSRCPSSLSPSHIKSLTTDQGEAASAWTLSEAVQAIVIMVNYHALSGLYLGTCKESTSVFKIEKYLQLKNKNRTKENKENLGESTDALMMLDEKRKQWKLTQKELKRKRSFSEGEVIAQSELLFKRALGELDIAGCDKMKESREETKPLMVQDFSWDEQGFSMMSTFFSDIATLLDDKFRAANSLVCKDEEDNKEQSSVFRRAVWNYVQSLYMVQHDDYNYNEVDEQLGENTKEFLDLCCLPPQSSVSPLLFFISSKFNHSVKVHVSILMTEARLQSLLLFALQAVMKHMS